MTTERAEQQYLKEHLAQWRGKGYEVYNPNSLPIEDLPIIYGFNDGGNAVFLSARLISQDGDFLGGHACSDEGYMPHDLGVIKGSRPDRHESFKEYYPDGYRMDFVPQDQALEHEGLQEALKRSKERQL